MRRDGAEAIDWPALVTGIRRWRGWSQRRLAHEVGACDRTGMPLAVTVRRWEQGRVAPAGAYREALLTIAAGGDGPGAARPFPLRKRHPDILGEPGTRPGREGANPPGQ